MVVIFLIYTPYTQIYHKQLGALFSLLKCSLLYQTGIEIFIIHSVIQKTSRARGSPRLFVALFSKATEVKELQKFNFQQKLLL